MADYNNYKNCKQNKASDQSEGNANQFVDFPPLLSGLNR